VREAPGSGVLAGVVAIALAATHDAKAERFVEGARLFVGGADLEGDRPQAAAPIVEDRAQELACEAAPAQAGMDRDVRDVQLVADLPQTKVGDPAFPVAEDPAARDAVLLDLVEEGAAMRRLIGYLL
jgi:hypothetical protein